MPKRTRTPKEIVPLPSVDGMLQFKPVRSAVNFLIANRIPYVDKGWYMEVKEADVPIKQKVIVRLEPEQPKVFTRPPARYSNPQWHEIYQ